MAVDASNLVLPRFASDDATADITPPTSSLRDTGWVGGATPDRPAAEHMNWLMRQNYEAHLAWRDILWYGASDTWAAQDPDLGGVADVGVRDILVATPLGLIIAVGDNGAISSSPDGETWTQRKAGVALGDLYGLATDGSIVLAVGGATGASAAVFSSSDGTTWTDRSSFIPATPDGGFKGIVWDGVNNLWLACTGDEQFYSNPFPTSQSWTLRKDIGSGGLYTRLAHNPTTGKTIGCSTTNSLAQVTTDGITWDNLNPLISGDTGYEDVQYANVNGVHTWMMAGRNTTAPTNQAMLALSIDDGVTWTALMGTTGFALGTHANAAAFSIGYSPVLKHWLVHSRADVGADALRALSPGDEDSISLRNFPPVMTDYANRVHAIRYVDLDTDRKNHYWLLGASADSNEAILKSGSPVI